MTNTQTAQDGPAEFPFKCGGLVCEAHRLSEIDSGKVMVTIDRQHIQRIRLRHGLVSPNPILQVAFGAAMTALGYFPSKHFIYWFQHGGTFFEAEALVIPLAVIGLWLLVTAFGRAQLLEVEMPSGKKRLAFKRNADADAVNQFVAEIERVYGVPVERESLLQ